MRCGEVKPEVIWPAWPLWRCFSANLDLVRLTSIPLENRRRGSGPPWSLQEASAAQGDLRAQGAFTNPTHTRRRSSCLRNYSLAAVKYRGQTCVSKARFLVAPTVLTAAVTCAGLDRCGSGSSKPELEPQPRRQTPRLMNPRSPSLTCSLTPQHQGVAPHAQAASSSIAPTRVKLHRANPTQVYHHNATTTSVPRAVPPPRANNVIVTGNDSSPRACAPPQCQPT